jgi:hypothetical protein
MSSREELQKELDKLQAETAEIKAELPGVFDGSTGLPEDGRKASEATEEEIERAQVLRDPWDVTNALRILSNPPGKVLRWISPAYRAQGRGMRGWTAVRYDDPIGRELDLYIPDPPSRMEGMVKLDNVVRRGDVVLCWIDEGVYARRRQKNFDKSNRHLADAAQHKNKSFGKFGSTYGDGLRDDDEPGFKEARTAPGMVSRQRLRDYQAASKSRLRQGAPVVGTRMFPRPEDTPQE